MLPDCDVYMLWFAAEEDNVGKEGQSPGYLKRPFHNYDIRIYCTKSYVEGTEAAFGHSLQESIK